MTNSKKPAVRFKGFTDAWVQRKLGKVADIIGGGTPNTGTDEYWNGDIDWYTPAEIGDQIFLEGSQRKITELGFQENSVKMHPIGTVLFTSRAGIGNTAILTKTGTTNQGFQSIVPHENELDSYFIFSRTPELKKYGETFGAGSTFIEVSGKQMAEMPMLMPTLSEQTAIGIFFRTIDDTITLHKRKLDKLKDLKKAYMQQMFPQDDESVPRMRFAGFGEEWKQRKIEEVFSYVSSTHTSNNFVHVAEGYPLFDANKQIGNIEKYDQEPPYISIIKDGAGAGRLVKRPGKSSVIATMGYLMPTGVLMEFGFALLETIDFTNFISGTTIPHIYYKDYGQNRVHMPKIHEQIAIGSFFHTLDEQMTSQQAKLDKLKEIKKAYLQRMFV
jgi:type I restriction enzyme S subunit